MGSLPALIVEKVFTAQELVFLWIDWLVQVFAPLGRMGFALELQLLPIAKIAQQERIGTQLMGDHLKIVSDAFLVNTVLRVQD